MSDPSEDSTLPAERWQAYKAAGDEAMRHHRMAEAEEHYQDALREAERLGPDDPRLAEALTDLGRLLSCARFPGYAREEAEACLRRALALREQALGKEHPEVARNLLHLATLYSHPQHGFRVAEPESAIAAQVEPLLQRALAIIEGAAESDPKRLLQVLGQLTGTYAGQGRDAEVERLLLRMLTHRQQLHGPEHPSVVSQHIELASFYQRLGRTPETETHLQQALSILTTTPECDPQAVAFCLKRLSHLYRQARRYAEMEAPLRQALSVEEGLHGPAHPALLFTLTELVQILTALGRYEEAEQHLLRARTIEAQATDALSAQSHPLLKAHTDLLKATGRFLQALEMEDEAQRTHRRERDPFTSIRDRVLSPPPHPEQQPAFVWISFLTVGSVTHTGAEVRCGTTGEVSCVFSHRHTRNGSGGSAAGRGGRERDQAQPITFPADSGHVEAEVLAPSAAGADRIATPITPAKPGKPAGAPRIRVESSTRLLGGPSFAEVEVRLLNAGDGDALRARLAPPACRAAGRCCPSTSPASPCRSR
jgi:tetratricopeptide (TPR) repeat protein